MLFLYMKWNLPEPINRTLSQAAGGIIPVMLILLGLELQYIERSRNLRAISIPLHIRLVLGPLISLGMAAIFGLQNQARQAGVTETSMPPAVMTTVLAAEFKLDSRLVTAIVFVSTILSPLTLTIVLYYLGR
jgi:predicted permease